MDEIKQNQIKLIQALRSGNYKQCRFSFQDDDARCVLGLSLDLFGIDYGELGKGAPLHQLSEKLGIEVGMYTSISAAYPDYTGLQGIAMLNDRGRTFRQLADILISEYNFAEPAMDYKLNIKQGADHGRDQAESNEVDSSVEERELQAV